MAGPPAAEALHWKRGPLLGCGSFGSVNLATLPSGSHLAVKTVECDGPLQHLASLEKEIEVLQTIHSPRVVRTLGADWTVEGGIRRRNLLLEYVPRGSVADVMKLSGGTLAEHSVRSFTHDLLEGLRDLHASGYAHCDIKGRNLLVGEDGIKLCDLGSAEKACQDEKLRVGEAHEMKREEESGDNSEVHDNFRHVAPSHGPICRIPARQISHSQTSSFSISSAFCPPSLLLSSPLENAASPPHKLWQQQMAQPMRRANGNSIRGTVCWMAPEVVKLAQADFKAGEKCTIPGGLASPADIWSVGCTVIEMITGKPPWGAAAGCSAAVLFQLGCTAALPPFPSSLSTEGRDFLALCLQRDPAKRPTAAELLSHPFVKSAAPSASVIPSMPPSPSQPATVSALTIATPALVASHSSAKGSPLSCQSICTPPVALDWLQEAELKNARLFQRRKRQRRASADTASPLCTVTDSLQQEQPCSGAACIAPPKVEVASPSSSCGGSALSSLASWWSSNGSASASQGPWLVVRSPKAPRPSLVRRRSHDMCEADYRTLDSAEHASQQEPNSKGRTSTSLTSRFAHDIVA
eukprot:TRINITY_DN29380_c0_g1_i1.p1 TRINITY_DN29380_c0_g1~~TRINITY_DN29380_c0_g1_i1.p1  ORF type:complete len:580 (+),score=71.68 TRINITY_DN29380_c0_g1_i1:138-1877(+)